MSEMKIGDKVYLAKGNMFSTLRAKIRVLFYHKEFLCFNQELLDVFIGMINIIEKEHKNIINKLKMEINNIKLIKSKKEEL